MLLNKNYQKSISSYVLTHLWDFTTIQSGHLKPPARTKVSFCKISSRKNKATIIMQRTVVIMFDNSHIDVKYEDLWSGRLRRDQDMNQTLLVQGGYNCPSQ